MEDTNYDVIRCDSTYNTQNALLTVIGHRGGFKELGILHRDRSQMENPWRLPPWSLLLTILLGLHVTATTTNRFPEEEVFITGNEGAQSGHREGYDGGFKALGMDIHLRHPG
jgi:hypothetical protein